MQAAGQEETAVTSWQSVCWCTNKSKHMFQSQSAGWHGDHVYMDKLTLSLTWRRCLDALLYTHTRAI